MKNKELFCYTEKTDTILNESEIINIVEKKVDQLARLDDEKTNSGFVLLKKPPSLGFYKKTVREIVKLNEAEKLLESINAYFKGYKNKRGLIGATASVAWNSKNDRTFELITYRENDKWGTKRYVDDNSTKKMDEKIVTSFDNFDLKNKHNRLVPSSPCPVLYGIRGDNSEDLIDAKSIIDSEKIKCWLLFESNQGTDDHLQRKKIIEIRPYDSVIVKGSVKSSPKTIKGGHVIFKIKDKTGSIDCAAYEPTKQFRNIIRKLVVGDIVEVYGGVRKKPLTVNLEKIKIIKLKKVEKKVENPVCPNCEKHMKSKGKNQGFKCKKCGKTEDKAFLKEENRLISPGLYEVPVCARRHLSKPLKRFK
jgi:tRNA(Ile2)-agmatinylcytidine synthase